MFFGVLLPEPFFIYKSQHLGAVISVFVSHLTLPSTMLYHDVF